MLYNENPEFNDYIDQHYGDVVIGDFCRPASLVLFEMDDIEYRSLYNQYLDEQKISVLDQVIDVFPAPIAFHYERALHGYDNYTQRLHYLRSTWEAIILFIYALTVGEIIDKSLSISSVKIFKNQRIYCDGGGLLSDKLGYKIEVVEKILDFNNNGCHGLIVGDLIPISVISILRDLNSTRNSISHTSALSEEQAKELFEENHPNVKELLFELRKLSSLSLLKFKSTITSITKIRFSRFRGFSLRDRNYEKDVDREFMNKNLVNLRDEYLFCEFEDDDQVICLSPFASTLNHNGQNCIAWYKKLDNSASKYFFEIVSDSPVEIDLDANIFEKPIQALRDLL
jgi:hypothetical protein